MSEFSAPFSRPSASLPIPLSCACWSRSWHCSAIFAVLGIGGICPGCRRAGALDRRHERGIAALGAVVTSCIGGWLLFRIVALAVMSSSAPKNRPRGRGAPLSGSASCSARAVLCGKVGDSLRSPGRALVVNLLVLPIALALLFTGIGTVGAVLARQCVAARARFAGSGLGHDRERPAVRRQAAPVARTAFFWADRCRAAHGPVPQPARPDNRCSGATHLVHRKPAGTSCR